MYFLGLYGQGRFGLGEKTGRLEVPNSMDRRLGNTLGWSVGFERGIGRGILGTLDGSNTASVILNLPPSPDKMESIVPS